MNLLEAHRAKARPLRKTICLPEAATAACLSLVSEDWLTTTSDLVFPAGAAG